MKDKNNTENELLAVHEQYLIENATDIIFIQDLDLNLHYVSPSVESLAGYTVEEALELTVKDLLTVDSFEKAQKSLQRYVELAKEKKNVNVPLMQYEYVRKDGSTFWGELRVRFLRDSTGHPVGVHGILRDITERKRVDEALRKSKNKIEELHSIATQLGVCSSEEEVYKIAVDAAENVLDFDVVEVLIREGDMLAVKAKSSSLPDIEAQDMGINEGVAGKTYQTNQSYLSGNVKKDRIASPSSDKYRSGISIPIGTLGVFQAISTETNSFNQEDLKMGELLVSHVREALDRIQHEEALRKSEEKYRTLFERVPVGIYRTTPEGKIIDTNPALIEMLGYPNRDLLLTREADDLFIESYDREREKAFLERNGEIRNFTSQMRRYDGTIIWVQDNARAVLDEYDNVLFYEGSLQDITQRKKAEEEAEFYNSLLRHDISNKIQVMMGYLGMLERTDLSDKQETFVKKAVSAAKSSSDLIRKVRDLEKLKDTQELITLSLDDVIVDTIQNFSHHIEDKGIKVTYDLSEIRVKASPLLEEIFVNLIQNAVIHSGCNEITIHASSGKEYYLVSIEDDGKGIPNEYKKRIFQRSVKGTESEGSGIGLHLVKMILESFNGKIEVVDRVEGNYSKGTRFNVYIPRR